MKKNLTLSMALAGAIIALAFFAAQPAEAAQTNRISSFVVNDGYSSALGATTNYSITLTTSQALPLGSRLVVNVYRLGESCSVAADCQFNFNSATVSGHSTQFIQHLYSYNIGIAFDQEISAGTVTFSIDNVVNPATTGMYIFSIFGEYGSNTSLNDDLTASNRVFLGAIAMKGQVTKPNGTPVANAIVNIRTQDFSVNIGTGTDSTGYYMIPVTSDNGTVISGTTYLVDLWPPLNADGIVTPDQATFVYGGSIVTKNLSFLAATKTITITVKYDNGNPVTLANVWANKRGGGSNLGGQVNANGVTTLSLVGGSWDVGINCPTGPGNIPLVCDWSWNQPPIPVDFANNSVAETANLAITVIKATAVIKGKVILPNGSALTSGFVDVRKDGSSSMGAGINGLDGSFTTNVQAGDYQVTINPDTNNPNFARYYSETIAVRVADNETKDLGTITMKQKNSSVSGKVIDESGAGIANVRINAWLRNGNGWSNTVSGLDGSYIIYMSPGEWEINIDNGPQAGNYISVDSRPNSVILSDNQAVTGNNIVVKLADAALTVKLVDASGNAIGNINGYAYARKKGGGYGPGSEFGGGVDRGVATVRLIGGQTYVVGVNMPADAGVGYSLKEETEVTVALGETKVVKLTLVPNDATISGFVKDQSGSLVKNLDAEVYVQDDSYQWRGTKLQADGTFSFSVRGGKKYMAGVNLRGMSNSAGYMTTFPKPSDAFEVPANATFTKIITIMKADSSISGVVKKPDGTVMAHAWVNVNNFKFMESKVKADVASAKVIEGGTEAGADGTFTIPVVAGQYEVMAGMPPEFSGNYMPPKSISVEATAAKPVTNVVMQFRQSDATVVASVLLPDGTKPDMGYCHAWSQEGGNSGKEVMNGTAAIPLTAGNWYIGCDSFKPTSNKFYRSDEIQLAVTKGSSLAKTFKLEEGLFEIPKGVTETFSATSQKSITLPDGTSVSIPANALASEGNVTFIATPDVNLMFTKDTKPINFAWDFEVMDSSQQVVQSFNSNVTICIPYDKDYLDKINVDENTLVAKYYSSTSGTWQLPDGVTQDFTNHKVCFSVAHFTNFALATGSTISAASSGPAYIVATPVSKGGPQVTIWDGSNGQAKLNFFAYASNLRFGIQTVSGDLDGDGTNEIIVVPGAGAGPQIRIFDLQGHVIRQFFAFASSVKVGVNLAVADVNGDGNDEIIVTTMAGAGPQIRIFDGNGRVVKQFFVYAANFRGGVNLTTGDVDGDGIAEIIVAPASAAAPQVKVYNYDGTMVSQFYAYTRTLQSGYHISTGDVNNDGTADIVVTTKAGVGPQLAMFNGNGSLIGRFFAYTSTFRGGFYASVGDVNGDGSNEIVTTPESQAGPQVRVFTYQGTVISQFFAYASRLRGSFTSVVADVDQDGSNEIITAPGAGMGPQVRVFNYRGTAEKSFFTHNSGFRGGIALSTVPVF